MVVCTVSDVVVGAVPISDIKIQEIQTQYVSAPGTWSFVSTAPAGAITTDTTLGVWLSVKNFGTAAGTPTVSITANGVFLLNTSPGVSISAGGTYIWAVNIGKLPVGTYDICGDVISQ